MYRAATAAMGQYRAHAIQDAAGITYPPEKVVLHEASLANGRELVLQIKVDGRVLARKKAKRAKLAAMVVRHDSFRQYYLDCIDPEGDAEDWTRQDIAPCRTASTISVPRLVSGS